MSDPEPHDSRSDAELARDRASLQARLDALKSSRAAEEGPEPSRAAKGMAEGFKIASEFIAGIVVGAVIGYGIDQLFGTTPFGLIVFLLFGFAAGVLNVVRTAGRKPTAP
ncbi:AtpZ/AtpI family protein [Aureimonas jatrophae]|jgi:ATP synthase protein I|uniref:ATP synthase protein I n=1 Tax=Aureimonas jatrophae TaxID=1166073 RepID=A0A1H0GL94_9HYPH|nr:AtpZ/AtpI family protein [Aureimonas jatrophae]MBB3949623.1 ATP synthase protein I [Aureimonas jatrophae]SDO07529.1 ATP synthase protein I [Aureimonas jatrophae]